MCGICGIVTNNPIPYDITGKMCKALTHRGPDGEGRYSDDDISIAMRRLSIIDLNNGWQPLYNEDGTIVLIINGEIYNYVELRKDLEDKGHLFTTKTDGEVILHLYEEYGTECVNYLRGMFAFGIRDIKRNQLILARDRMGEKPLYLYESDNLFLFSSEMKSLLTSGIISFELNPDSVNLFFHYQYVPEPLTLIKNIRKLPKGCILIINTKTMDKTEYCYWKMESAPILTGNPIDEIRKILDDISNIVIRSDVPVGIALSGGLDSSLVAALTAKKYPDTMQAFSIGYPGLQACDERADAEVFAEYIGMPFNDIELNTSDLVSFFPELVYHQDDPIADISGYGYYSVMKLAKEHNCPVMLQGQGGDELFFGYSWLSKAVQQSLRKQKNKTQDKFCINDYYKFKFPDIRHPISCIQYIKNYGGLKIAIKELKRDKTSPDNQLVFMDLIPDFQVIEEKYNTLFTKETINKIDKRKPYTFFSQKLPWKQIDITVTKLISESYLLENGITQADRLSMASSVELRLPLVDYRLVETVIGLMKNNPYMNINPKGWLKEAAKPILPEWVINRPKKGFTPPVLEWEEALFDSYGEYLENGYLVEKNIIRNKTAKILAKGQHPYGTSTPPSFKGLILEIWCRKMQDIVKAAC